MAGAAKETPSNTEKLRTVEAVRKFLRDGGVPDGQWCFSVKAQYERLMELAGIVPLFIRVWACTQTHAMGFLPSSAGLASFDEKGRIKTRPNADLLNECKKYGGVLALTSVGGRLKPLTPSLIASELNRYALTLARREDANMTDEQLGCLEVESEAVRREIVQLEWCGFAVRTDEQGTLISELGQEESRRLHVSVRLYVFLKPRKSPLGRGLLSVMLRKHKASKEISTVVPIRPEPLPEQLIFDFVRCDVGISREKLTEYARQPKIQMRMYALKKRQEELDREKAELEEQLLALAAEEAQGKLFDSSGSGDSIPASAGINATLSPDAKPEMVNGDGNSAPVPAGGPLEPEPPAILDWDVVGKAAAEYATINDTWVRQIVTRCQQQTPDVTPAELVQLIHQKGRNATHKQNAAGYLMTYVPQDCQGESFRRMRERLKEARDEEARRKRAASEPLPEYREPTTADLIEECDRRIAEARKELKAAKHTSDIVKIEDRIHFLESRKKQLSRQLTEVAS